MEPCQGIDPGLEDLALVCHDVFNLVGSYFLNASQMAYSRSYSIPSGGVSTFGPLIVKSFGFDEFKAILFNIPFGSVQLVATMGGAWLAMVLKVKGPVLTLLSLPPIAGCVMLLCIPHDASQRSVLLVGYYLVRYATCIQESHCADAFEKISVYPGISTLSRCRIQVTVSGKRL